MVSYLLFALGVLLVASPGIYCWTLLFPNDCPQQRVAWGSVLGIAAAVYLAYVCAFAHLSWFYAVWAALLILSAGTFGWRFWQRRLNLFDPGRGFWTGLATSPTIALVFLLLLIVVLETIVVMSQSVPAGWDPSFHLLLAKKIALSDRIIRDWQPFEDAALNYPLGSHFLIALFARFSGLPLPCVFQFLMLTFSVFTALAVYALGSEYFASEIVGVYAAIAYGFWAWWGSGDYFRWGGLPNQLGMLLGLGVLSLVVRGGEQRKSTVLMALLFASLCLTHHHVMLTMGFILIVLGLFFLATNDPERRYRTIFFALAIAAVAAAFFLVPYAMKAVSLSDTQVFHVDDSWAEFGGLGPALIFFALGGLALDYSRKAARPRVFHLVLATLMLLWFLFGPLYYFYQLNVTGKGFVAFTPSRFITDLAYFLSLFAGYALYRLQTYCGWSGRVTIAIALLFAFVNRSGWDQVLVPDSDRGRFAAYGWIANHTPSNSIVMTRDSWACYASWRRTLSTPMPVSEPRVPPRISEKANQELLAGRSPEELRGIQLLAVFGPSDHDKGRLLWSNSDGWGVSEVYPNR